MRSLFRALGTRGPGGSCERASVGVLWFKRRTDGFRFVYSRDMGVCGFDGLGLVWLVPLNYSMDNGQWATRERERERETKKKVNYIQ